MKNFKAYLEDLVFIASRPQNLQRDELVYVMASLKYPALKPKIVTTPIDEKNRNIYSGKKFLGRLLNFLLKKVGSEKRFEKHLKEYNRIKHEHTNDVKILGKVPATKKGLLSGFQTYLKKMTDLSDATWIPFLIEGKLDKLVQDSLVEKHLKDYEWMYYAITSPTELHEYQKMRLDICEAAIKGEVMKDVLKELTKKYYWHSEYTLVEPLLDEAYFEKEISKLDKAGAKVESEKIKKDIKKNWKEFKKAISMIKQPKLKLYARIVNKYVWLRTDRVDEWRKLQAAVRPLYDKLAEFLKKDTGQRWDKEAVVKLLNQEIFDYLRFGSCPDLRKTLNRSRRYIYIRDWQITRVIDNKPTVEEILSIIETSRQKSTEVRGKIAHPGKVSGRVSLVLDKSDLNKVKIGSVLVARHTMVSYIEAMEKTSAFVTEEGGVTSHAAIVARELKKPCIVGTGNCTKILKDGDMVEVDAERGIVKKIE